MSLKVERRCHWDNLRDEASLAQQSRGIHGRSPRLELNWLYIWRLVFHSFSPNSIIPILYIFCVFYIFSIFCIFCILAHSIVWLAQSNETMRVGQLRRTVPGVRKEDILGIRKESSAALCIVARFFAANTPTIHKYISRNPIFQTF